MEDAYSKSTMMTCAGVALILFIIGVFVVFKGNQLSMNSASTQSSTRLQAELSEATGTTVKGSYIKSLMTASPNSTNVEIWVDNTGTGAFAATTLWAGTTATITTLVTSDTQEYIPMAPTTNGTKTVYKFNKKI